MPLFHPTHAVLFDPSSNVEIEYSSRTHRKKTKTKPKPETACKALAKTRWLAWKPRSISWVVATVFLLGSVVWTVNGVFAFWPNVVSSAADTYVTSWTGFAGGTLFFLSCWLMVTESLNVGTYRPMGVHVLQRCWFASSRYSLGSSWRRMAEYTCGSTGTCMRGSQHSHLALCISGREVQFGCQVKKLAEEVEDAMMRSHLDHSRHGEENGSSSDKKGQQWVW